MENEIKLNNEDFKGDPNERVTKEVTWSGKSLDDMIEVEREKKASYDKGVSDGRATQAILELHGRDRFLEGLKKKKDRVRQGGES